MFWDTLFVSKTYILNNLNIKNYALEHFDISFHHLATNSTLVHLLKPVFSTPQVPNIITLQLISSQLWSSPVLKPIIRKHLPRLFLVLVSQEAYGSSYHLNWRQLARYLLSVIEAIIWILSVANENRGKLAAVPGWKCRSEYANV